MGNPRRTARPSCRPGMGIPPAVGGDARERPRRLSRPGPWLPLLLLAGALAAPPASAQIGQQPLLVTVGSDAACDRSTLAAALIDTANNAGPDFIRIASNHTDASIAVRITSQQVTIEGGFDDCGDTTASGQTTLDGSGGSVASVIEIATKPAGATGVDVLLRNLVIRGGENDAVSGDPGGGGIEISGGMDVRLENVTVRDNLSTRGGGIFVSGGSTSVVIADGSRVRTNSALLGGGVYCDGAFGALVDSRVAGNIANESALGDEGNGGGVYATGGCLFRVRAGGPGDGVLSNEAANRGAGIYATGGSRIDLWGDASGPARVAANGLLGGASGIRATGSGTRVLAENAHILGNGGNGIFVDEGVLFRMERTLGDDCHTVDRCSRLSGNGSAFFARESTLEISGTYIEDNRAVGRSFRSVVRAEGLVVARNGSPDDPPRIAMGVDDSDSRIAFTTFVDNEFRESLIAQVRGTLELYSSIVSQPSPAVFDQDDSPITSIFDCLIVNDASTLPATTTRTLELDHGPLFADLENGDYHLTLLSPAIDFCDDSVYSPEFPDIDGDLRGVDAGAPSGELVWDLGADELIPVPEPGPVASSLAVLAVLGLARRWRPAAPR